MHTALPTTTPGPQKHLLRSTCRSTQVSKPNTRVPRGEAVYTQDVIQANSCFLLIFVSVHANRKVNRQAHLSVLFEMNWSCQRCFCRTTHEMGSLCAYVFWHEVSLESKQIMCSALKTCSYPSLTNQRKNRRRGTMLLHRDDNMLNVPRRKSTFELL